jgi:hypothetical protein
MIPPSVAYSPLSQTSSLDPPPICVPSAANEPPTIAATISLLVKWPQLELYQR